MSVDSTFRGEKSIREVIERMVELAAWQERFKPGLQTLRLYQKDFDLIIRWPKAAFVHHIVQNENGVFWRSFTLLPDGGEARYRRHQSEQVTLT
jgi:hypothetical protein